jgi:NhaP-type Na+/H+ or K+/H+ antiporter
MEELITNELNNINMEKVLAPYFFGALVGFIAFYFIRKYKDYSTKSLKATLGVMALNFILPTIMVFIDADFFYRYLIGVSVGVLLYLIYLITLKKIKEKGWILDFEGYASCGPSEEEMNTLFKEINQPTKKNKNSASKDS